MNCHLSPSHCSLSADWQVSTRRFSQLCLKKKASLFVPNSLKQGRDIYLVRFHMGLLFVLVNENRSHKICVLTAHATFIYFFMLLVLQ